MCFVQLRVRVPFDLIRKLLQASLVQVTPASWFSALGAGKVAPREETGTSAELLPGGAWVLEKE